MNESKGEAERVRALEEMAAHQALAIEEMSGELAALAADLRSLKGRFDALLQRLSALEEASGDAPPVTKPPHW